MSGSVANQPDPGIRYYAKRDDSVKSADPQFFVGVDPAATIEEMENAIWQNIGGHEIISLVRRDLVDGINLDYTLINNLRKLYEEYNPQNIISIEDSSRRFFDSFGIKLENHVPSDDSLSKIDENLIVPVGLSDDLRIIVYVKDIRDNQEVEVQSLVSEALFRDTIYGEEL